MKIRFAAAFCALGAGVVLAAASSADAGVVTFDDLQPAGGGTIMPAMYGGLRWGQSLTSWHYMAVAANPTNTFLALSGTSTFFGSPIGGSGFIFEGADFWSRRGADANGDFAFVLYRQGQVVYNGLEEAGGRQRFGAAPQLFSPGYAGVIDGVALAFDNDDWDHLAMDNVRVTFVPAPGCVALAIAAVAVVTPRRRGGRQR